MAKQDTILRKLNKEIDAATKERCRINGEHEAGRMNSTDWEQATLSNTKRWQDACFRRNARMVDLGLTDPPQVDSLIR